MTESSAFERFAADDGIVGAEPGRSDSNGEVLDWKELCDRCMGNLELVERVLNKFEDRLPVELAELERVLEMEDAATIALVAHRIRGSSSNVSATGLQEAASEIEDLSRGGRMADIPARIENLRQEWDRYLDRRGSLRQLAKKAKGDLRVELTPAHENGGAS
jgi:HPt (histidine-containing phosphotransfer) domain-containing protein